MSGDVRIQGRVIDADAHCGDGIAWRMSLSSDASTRDLAAGAFTNGGAQAFDQADGGKTLDQVTVTAGQTLQLAVYPKGEYSCDSTVVEWTITERNGAKRTWQLAGDLLNNPVDDEKGNPHNDSFGNAGVWSFYEVPDVAATGLAAENSAMPDLCSTGGSSPGRGRTRCSRRRRRCMTPWPCRP